MAYELNIPLDPSTQSSLTVVALLYVGSSLPISISLTESPVGSARYTNSTNIVGLAAGSYIVMFESAGTLVGSGTIGWDGTQEITSTNMVLQPLLTTVAQYLATLTQHPSVSSNASNTAINLGTAVVASSVGGAYQSISVFENSAPSLQYTVTLNGTPVNLTGHLFTFSIYDDSANVISQVLSATAPAQFIVSTPAGGTVANALQVNLLPANLSQAGTYRYSVKDVTTNMTLATGQIGILVSV